MTEPTDGELARDAADRARSCDGKARLTARGAELLARQRSRETGLEHRAYACRFCPKHHVGRVRLPHGGYRRT